MLRSCALALAMLLLALPALAYAQTTATSGSASGGTPAASSDSDPTISSSGGAATSAAASDATSAGTDAPMSGDVPLATVAQEPEPEPEPEGPGEEQPGEPGGEPQTPTGEDPVEVPGAEAPATGGGLPRTGIEVLKLGLLGLVLVLVGARIRAVLKRRGRVTGLAPDGLPHAAPSVATRGRRDEWSFPDPDEAAPTGLLPSTAMARRKARMREP
jgi:hypothetical protein